MADKKLVQWIEIFADRIEEEKAQLNDYDTPIGDGDHGTNMSRGMKAVIEMLNTKDLETNADLLKSVGMTLLSKVGGASGPLYGSAFISMAKEIDDSLTKEVVQAGFDSISKRGKSTTKEKTMLDVWGPIAESNVTTLTKEDIQAFAASTDDMKATKGRASFLGDRSIGHRDPGAASSALLFEAAIDAGVFA